MSPRRSPHPLIGAVAEAWEAGMRCGRARRRPRKQEVELWRQKGLLQWYMQGHRQGKRTAAQLEQTQMELL